MNVLAVVGPTASGKSAIAEAIAREFAADIVSVDSMQVYRGMDIGTAKPSQQVRDEIVHHMVDIVPASDELTVAEFQVQGREALDRGGRFVIAGGSGLHFRALVDPMTFAPTDPDIRMSLEQAPFEELQQELLGIDHHAPDVLDIHNPRRVIRAIEIWRITASTPSERAVSEESLAVQAYTPKLEHVTLGVDAGTETAGRVEARLAKMMSAGFLDEVTRLAPSMSRTARQAVGYREMLSAIEGRTSEADAIDESVRATNRLAKRQRTYFGKDPRIQWMPWQDEESARINSAMEFVREVAKWTS